MVLGANCERGKRATVPNNLIRTITKCVLLKEVNEIRQCLESSRGGVTKS